MNTNFINKKSVTFTIFFTLSSFTHAAQCQAPNGKFYPYDSPQCDPKIAKCSSSIDHLIRQKTVDSAWMQELQKICKGAKVDENGKITILNVDKFHIFNLGIPNRTIASNLKNYSNEIISRCKISIKKLDCENSETKIYCSALATTTEKSNCFKQMQLYHENKVKEIDQEIERAKRDSELRIQGIKQQNSGD